MCKIFTQFQLYRFKFCDTVYFLNTSVVSGTLFAKKILYIEIKSGSLYNPAYFVDVCSCFSPFKFIKLNSKWHF